MNKLTIVGLFLTLWLLPFIFACGGGGSEDNNSGNRGIVTLTWDAPTTNADGTPLNDLAGYKIYYGYPSKNYTIFIDVGMPLCQTEGGKTACTYKLNHLPSGTYFFAITAYDESGNMSMYSNEVTKTIE